MHHAIQAQKLREAAKLITEVHKTLDRSKVPCDHCSVNKQNNRAEFHLAVKLEGAISLLNGAANNFDKGPLVWTKKD